MLSGLVQGSLIWPKEGGGRAYDSFTKLPSQKNHGSRVLVRGNTCGRVDSKTGVIKDVLTVAAGVGVLCLLLKLRHLGFLELDPGSVLAMNNECS